MFGLSFPKLLVLVGVILAVWYGFKLLSRLEAARREERLRRPAPPPRASGKGLGEAEEMRECAVCKAYVPQRGAGNCGRPDCPR